MVHLGIHTNALRETLEALKDALDLKQSPTEKWGVEQGRTATEVIRIIDKLVKSSPVTDIQHEAKNLTNFLILEEIYVILEDLDSQDADPELVVRLCAYLALDLTM